MACDLIYFFNAIRSLLGGVESKYKANNHIAYCVKCPYCLKHGSVLGLGKDKESYLLLCPNCEKGYSLNTLIYDHGTDDLKDAWWKFRSGWIDYQKLGYPILHPKNHETQCQKKDSSNFKSKMLVASEIASIYVNNEQQEQF